MLRTLTIVAFLGLAACGGGSKPAPATPEEESTPTGEEAGPVDEPCCCDYILEAGEGDEMSENQTYEMMSPADCEGNSGTCGDASACGGE